MMTYSSPGLASSNTVMSKNPTNDFDFWMKEWIEGNPKPLKRNHPKLASILADKNQTEHLHIIAVEMNAIQDGNDIPKTNSKIIKPDKKAPPIFLNLPRKFLLIERQMIEKNVLNKFGKFHNSRSLANVKCIIGIVQFIYETEIFNEEANEDNRSGKISLCELVEFLNKRWRLKLKKEVYRHAKKYREAAYRIPYIKDYEDEKMDKNL